MPGMSKALASALLLAGMFAVQTSAVAHADQAVPSQPASWAELQKHGYTAPDGARLVPNPDNPESPYVDLPDNQQWDISAGGCTISWSVVPTVGPSSSRTASLTCASGNPAADSQALQACSDALDDITALMLGAQSGAAASVSIAKFQADMQGCPLAADAYAFMPLFL
ncbi:MAG TPA: hypothetical protein VFS62_08095 [Chloroflexota bacterium]|nr:hypothetical protein [Chloroflexota bacterium]